MKISGGKGLHLTDSAFPVCQNPAKKGQHLDEERRCESQKEKVLYMKGTAETCLIVLLSHRRPWGDAGFRPWLIKSFHKVTDRVTTKCHMLLVFFEMYQKMGQNSSTFIMIL